MQPLKIPLPHNGWKPRAHQRDLWRYLEKGGKRAMVVWHRRAGKDEVCLHHAALSLATRPGNYWHCLPEFLQGRKAIWTAINAHTGKRRIDEVFPHALRENTNDNEMFIRFKNGSTWQIIGSDRYDATLGAGVAGITYSEWALANPSAWGYHRPMLAENDGWAIFITTPRGHNHAKQMFDYAAVTRDWFCELKTALDTGALTPDELDKAREEYCTLYGRDLGNAQFQQEYMCNWNAAILGAFYAIEMQDVRADGRIIQLTAADDVVHCAWDLGIRDDTAIWFFQQAGNGQILLLDCLSESGVGVDWFAAEIARRCALHGWVHGTDFVPHDAKIKEWGTGKTRIETMLTLNLHPMPVALASIADGINAVRRVLPLCVFDPRCESGIEALEQYRREWNDELKTFRASPVHNWASHYADAFRYLAQTRLPPVRMRKPERPSLRRGIIIPPPPDYTGYKGLLM